MVHNDRRVPDGIANRPYVERHPDLERFSPALRRARMAVEPAFFGWDAPRQDRYRREMPDAHYEKLVRRLESEAGSSHVPGRNGFALANAVNALSKPCAGFG